MNRLAVTFLILAAIASSSAVVELTDFTFDSYVTVPDAGVWFVRFYAPWCGHCKAMESTWIETAEKLKDEVHFANVDATEEYGLAHRYEIHSFPTIVLISEGKVYRYDGSRTVDGFSDFALSLYKMKPFEDNPSMPPKIIILFQKYMNKANLYLYQHPLFTVCLLVGIGFVFGACVVVLIFETVRTNRLMKMMEEEEAAQEKEIVQEEQVNDNIQEETQEETPENKPSEE